MSGARSDFREAARLAWPATLSLLLHALYRVNDQFWVQDLGPDAQAAMGVTTFMLILNFAFISVITSGCLARVARFTGAGETWRVRAVYRSAGRAGLLWFAAIGVAGWLTRDFWVTAGGAATPGVAAHARDYLGTIYLCLPLIAAKPFADSVFIGLGNTLVPMLLGLGAVLLNFVLNPLLIYGWWGFPELGIAGSAWATGVSRGLCGLAGILLLARYYGLRPRWRVPAVAAEVRRIFAIGLPVAASTAAYALVFLLVLKTSVEPLGRDVQAGLGVAFNGIESLSYCGMMGPAMAAASLVGRRLGAGDDAGARRGMRACMGMTVGIATVSSVVFLVARRSLAQAFTDEPQVVDEAALYLGVAAFTQVVTGADSVLQQSMAGAGRTFRMSVCNVLGYGLRVPLAWLFSSPLGWGAAGVWWALNLSNYLKLAAIFLLFRRLRLFGPAPAVTPPSAPSP